MQNLQNQSRYTTLSLVWDFLSGSRSFFFVSILAALSVNLFDMLSPQIIRVTIDSVIGDRELKLPAVVVEAVEHGVGLSYLKSHLWLAGVAIVFLAAGSAVFRYINQYFNSKGAERFAKTMRSRLFSHIQRLPFS